ncbi:MAG: sel1 repeat family protein [Gammaproteobacteria bacterium]|nr:sel1 repeat family protein [Gammaproteobacteria bacterium]
MKIRSKGAFGAVALAAVFLCAGAAAQSTSSAETVATVRAQAEKGSAPAQSRLGDLYWGGIGVAEDKQEAVRWYRKSAEQGFAEGQTNLALTYYIGVGVIEDHRESSRWFRKAAEQGNASAQFHLGVAYLVGNGITPNKRESYIWFSIAKANGDESASKNLEKNWRKFLSQQEIRSAEKEAAQRLEEIDRRKDEHDKKFGLL